MKYLVYDRLTKSGYIEVLTTVFIPWTKLCTSSLKKPTKKTVKKTQFLRNEIEAYLGGRTA